MLPLPSLLCLILYYLVSVWGALWFQVSFELQVKVCMSRILLKFVITKRHVSVSLISGFANIAAVRLRMWQWFLAWSLFCPVELGRNMCIWITLCVYLPIVITCQMVWIGNSGDNTWLSVGVICWYKVANFLSSSFSCGTVNGLLSSHLALPWATEAQTSFFFEST